MPRLIKTDWTTNWYQGRKNIRKWLKIQLGTSLNFAWCYREFMFFRSDAIKCVSLTMIILISWAGRLRLNKLKHNSKKKKTLRRSKKTIWPIKTQSNIRARRAYDTLKRWLKKIILFIQTTNCRKQNSPCIMVTRRRVFFCKLKSAANDIHCHYYPENVSLYARDEVLVTVLPPRVLTHITPSLQVKCRKFST